MGEKGRFRRQGEESDLSGKGWSLRTVQEKVGRGGTTGSCAGRRESNLFVKLLRTAITRKGYGSEGKEFRA